MISFTAGQLEAWLAQYLWPFVRIGACLMVAPVFGAAFVPARTRLILAGAIALIVAPLVPAPQAAPFSAEGFVITGQQIIIGVALGFALQIVFDAVALAGQLLANSLGLSFAFNMDPLRGVSTPVLAQLYTLLITLTFLVLDGHLALIETLVEGFRTLPIGTIGFERDTLWSLVLWTGTIVTGAVLVALPGMTAMLIVNLAFGIMSRAAPTLNLFAVGFPVTLVFGLLVLFVGLPSVQTGFIGLVRDAFVVLGDLQR